MNLRFSIKQSWGYENTLFFKPYNQNGRCFIAKQIRLPEEQLFWLKQEKSGSIITTIPNFQLHIETDFESNRPYLNCFFLGCMRVDGFSCYTNKPYIPFPAVFYFHWVCLEKGYIYIYIQMHGHISKRKMKIQTLACFTNQIVWLTITYTI